MKHLDSISEEQLNAFVDNELEESEQEQLFALSEESTELEKRLCRQRKLKEMVQHAYRSPPDPVKGRRAQVPGRWFSMSGLAAALLLAVGFLLGSLVSVPFQPGAAPVGQDIPDPVPVAGSHTNYLLHLASSDPDDMMRALERAEQFLAAADESDGVQVEIVANEGGIDLLRSDVTPFASRIRDLAAHDVLFFACSKTIQRLEEHGIDVQLVPQANRHFTALDRVSKRLQEGWEYVKL